MSTETQIVPHAGNQLVTLGDSALPLAKLIAMRSLITSAMADCMKDGLHYGKIPGCGDKPTLLQPGAQLLCTLFRLYPEYEIFPDDLPNDHRHYRVTCRLYFIGSEPKVKISEGVGECSSMESKHRFRKGAAAFEDTGDHVPGKYWDIKKKDGPDAARKWLASSYDGQNVGVKKLDDGWHIVIYGGAEGAKQEHDNPTDLHNTVLKIAKKRAYVDATITGTASSDFFTQDLEDIAANLDAYREGKPTVEVETSPVNGTREAAHPVHGPDDHSVTGGEGIDARPSTPGEHRIPSGKNAGLMLSELSPQQLRGYQEYLEGRSDIKPKMPLSRDNVALLAAINAYRAEKAPKEASQGTQTPSGVSGQPNEETASWKAVICHLGIKGAKGMALGVLDERHLAEIRAKMAEKEKLGTRNFNAADKKLAAALIEQAKEKSAPPDDEETPPWYTGKHHEQLSNLLSFEKITEADFMATAHAQSWLPAEVETFGMLPDDKAQQFCDNFADVTEGVRVYLEGRK